MICHMNEMRTCYWCCWDLKQNRRQLKDNEMDPLWVVKQHNIPCVSKTWSNKSKWTKRRRQKKKVECLPGRIHIWDKMCKLLEEVIKGWILSARSYHLRFCEFDWCCESNINKPSPFKVSITNSITLHFWYHW